MFLSLALLSGGAAAQDEAASWVDEGSSWPDLLAIDLTTCAEERCASVDDRACASTCDGARSAPPVCREVDCASCLDGEGECAKDGSCGERVCVLCAWPEDGGESAGVCRASSATPALGAAVDGDLAPADAGPNRGPIAQRSALDAEALRPSWALYEVKDHRYRLLTAGFLQGPMRVMERTQPTVERASGVRERIGKMGMLAFIQASRERGDDPIAHLFATGGGFDDSLRSSLESPSIEREHPGVVQASLESWPAVSDVRSLLLERTLPLPPTDKRASVITARLDREQLIDVDGALGNEQAARALTRRKDAFQLCYESAYKAEDAPTGKLVVDLTIDRSGRVVDVFLSEDELDSDALSLCVLSTVERIRFPAHPDEDLGLTATLAFRKKP